jgi:hypothetical protein
MAHAFKVLGKPWNQYIEMELKDLVAHEVAKNPGRALTKNKRAPFDGMVAALEATLQR